MIVAGQLVSPEGIRSGQVRFSGDTIDSVGTALGKADGTSSFAMRALYVNGDTQAGAQ